MMLPISMPRTYKRTSPLVIAVVFIMALVGLYFGYQYNYLLFHIIAELFSIIIAGGIFMVVWNTRRFISNGYLLFVGIAYLFIGGIDLAHTLTYKGINVVAVEGANVPTQLWIAARYLQSLTLLFAPIMLFRRIRPRHYTIIYSVLTLLILLSIFYWRVFPDCFTDQPPGLTAFKVYSEYFISMILIISAILVIRFKQHFDFNVMTLLLISIGLTMVSELAFSTYASVYSSSNMLGHLFKIGAFFFMYKAIIETGLAKPFDLMFRDLNQSYEQYHNLFRHMIDGFAMHKIILDVEGQPVDYCFLEVNEAFEQIMGLRAVVGKRATDVFPDLKDETANWVEIFGEIATFGESKRFDAYIPRLERWIYVTAYSPMKNYFVTILEDITRRKIAEEEVLRQREWLRVSLSSIGDAVLSTDAQGLITFINPVATELTGWSFEEAVGQPFEEVFHIADEMTQKRKKGIVTQVLATGKILRLASNHVLIDRSGRLLPIEDSAAPIRDHNEEIVGVVVVCHDVSEKRQAKRILEASEARFKLLSNTAGQLLAAERPRKVIHDLCYNVMEYLDCQFFFNFLIDDNTGHLHLNAFAGISKSDADKFEDMDDGTAICNDVVKNRKRIVVENINPNGIETSTRLISSFGIRAYCCHPLISDNSMIGTLSFGTHNRSYFSDTDIELMRIVADQVTLAIQRVQSKEALQNTNLELEKKVKERTATLLQLVESLEAEINLRETVETALSKANQQLTDRADQLRLLTGELTMAEQRERKRLSQILHDGLQQYLVVVRLRLEELVEHIKETDVQEMARYIEEVVKQSIDISRSLSAELSPPILYEGGLAAGFEWLKRWMHDKHAFEIELYIYDNPILPDDVKILIFESVRELLFNTIKHADALSAKVTLKSFQQKELCIIVSDTGTGFDVNKLNPGPDFKGGFGLLSIQERVHLIGGRIDIESTVGFGSQFTITVPMGVDPTVSTNTNLPSPATNSQNSKDHTIRDNVRQRILVVDDHALFRDGIVRVLNREPDMEVVGEARDGAEAIYLAKKLTPDLILMDIGMPVLNGIEATRKILSQSPQIKIIGLSMHEDTEHAKAMIEAGAVDYKNKSCRSLHLVETIRRQR